MAIEDFDEHEQSERVQQWLRENAAAIVAGIALGLLLIFGMAQWRNYKANHKAEAAALYQQLGHAATAKDDSAAQGLLTQLKDRYKDTPFATFASLAAAQHALHAGQPEQAIAELNWAHAHAGNAALKSLALLRIATVELGMKNAEASLATLAKLPANDYRALALELRGDALLALDRRDEARTAYADALAAYGPSGSQGALVELKLENLATFATNAPAAASSTGDGAKS